MFLISVIFVSHFTQLVGNKSENINIISEQKQIIQFIILLQKKYIYYWDVRPLTL